VGFRCGAVISGNFSGWNLRWLAVGGFWGLAIIHLPNSDHVYLIWSTVFGNVNCATSCEVALFAYPQRFFGPFAETFFVA